ncbi:Nif3-like dinuclear metal center hexameric protein, partial [Bacillus cereus]|nr:Nif3-like dinuclear metal center hexameric protein [Bacillus cereus]
LYTVQHAKFKGINLIVGSHTFTEVFGVESLVLKLKERDNSIEITRLNEDHLE